MHVSSTTDAITDFNPLLLLQFSLWIFVRYNVFGGGDSSLYGVEGPSFYLRNGLNNLNLILPLALIYPVVALLDLFQVTGRLTGFNLLAKKTS